MRGAVLDEPAVEQPAVGLPARALALVEGHQRALQRGEPVERHAGEVVVLQVIVRVQEREIPEPVAAQQRAPLRRVVGSMS